MNDPFQQFRAQGWCVIPNVIPADRQRFLLFSVFAFPNCYGVIAPSYVHNGDWRSRAVELAAAKRLPAWTEWADELPFYLRPAHLNDTQVYAPELAHPTVHKLLARILGPQPRAVSTTLVSHEPGTSAGRWHVGGPFRAIPSGTKKHVTVHWLFTGFTRENGGLLIRPRELTLTAPAGSVLIVDGQLEGAIAANNGDLVRISAVMDVAPAQDKAAQKVSPTMSNGVYQRLPAPLQSLYRSWLRG